MFQLVEFTVIVGILGMSVLAPFNNSHYIVFHSSHFDPCSKPITYAYIL